MSFACLILAALHPVWICTTDDGRERNTTLARDQAACP
jgi:hypothetical protein